MSQPSKHADLLNALHEIQQEDSLHVSYAVRHAAKVIVEQEAEIARLQALNESLAARVAAQSELLTNRAEKGKANA